MKNYNFKKGVISAVLASTIALSGCGANVGLVSKKEEEGKTTITISGLTVNESDIKDVVIGNKIVSVSDLRLVSSDNQIINSVDAVLSGNKFVSPSNLPFIKFSNNIEYMLVGDELVSTDGLKLFDMNTRQVVDNIDYAVINGELVPFTNVVINTTSNTNNNNLYVGNNNNSNFGFDYSNSAVITTSDSYEELTTEKFEELCANTIRRFEDLGIAISREDVIKFVAVYNTNKLKQDNQGLIREVIGNQAILEVFDDAAMVSATLNSYEAQNLIYNGKILSVADVIFDKQQQELARKFEAKKLEIVQANQGDRERMVEEWLYSLIDARSEFRLLDDSTKLLLLRHCVVPIDSVYFKDSSYMSTLTGNARAYMFQMIAPYGSTDEEIRNSIASHSEIKMMDSFQTCQEFNNSNIYTR